MASAGRSSLHPLFRSVHNTLCFLPSSCQSFISPLQPNFLSHSSAHPGRPPSSSLQLRASCHASHISIRGACKSWMGSAASADTA
jgi:hypothetical protein